MRIIPLLGIFLCLLLMNPSNAQNFMLMDSMPPTPFGLDGHYFFPENCLLETQGNQAGYRAVTGFSPTHLDYVASYAIVEDINNTTGAITGLKRYILGEVFSGAFPIADFGLDTTINAVGTDLDSMIYGAGQSLWRYNPITDVETFLGDFPPNLACGGGMTLREGILYMTSVNHELVQVDRLNPQNSFSIYTFPDTIAPINSMITIPFACDSVVTYAFSGRYGEPTQMYVLDFEDFSLDTVCNIDRHILAGAHYGEITIPSCNLFIDLDMDNSTTIGVDFQSGIVCSPPVNITDVDIDVFSEITIDSITLSLQGILDIGLENIQATPNANVSVSNNGTEEITLVNNGNAGFSDFITVLQSAFYDNSAGSFTYGQRQISFVVHSIYYESPPAIATITLGNTDLSLIADITPTCFNEMTGMVSLEGSGGTSPYSFIWSDGQQVSTLDNLAEGEYIIDIEDALGCVGEDTLFVSSTDSLYAILSSPADSICSNNGIIMAMPFGGTAPYTYTWNGNIGSEVETGLSASNHELLLTDSLGCSAIENYVLFEGDTLFTSEIINGCAGEIISWQGQDYDQDTTLCTAGTSFFGCDSIHCVQLLFQDTFYQEETFALCLGETLDWQGMSFDQDTSLCLTYINSIGCDSTLCLSLSFISRINNIEANICEDETYFFNGEVLTDAGTYIDTVFDGSICDSFIILNLNVLPPNSVEITTDGSLCTQETVLLSGIGQGQYNWSTGDNTPGITVNQAGWYYLSLTDADACIAIDSILLSEDAPQAIFATLDPNCPTTPNGSIQIDSTWGGSPPYLFALDNNTFQSTPLFSNLEAGEYTLTIEDTEGCQRNYNINLSEQSSLFFELGEDKTLKLGEIISLNPSTNATAPQIQWSTPALFRL
jgi:hypothetical protein